MQTEITFESALIDIYAETPKITKLLAFANLIDAITLSNGFKEAARSRIDWLESQYQISDHFFIYFGGDHIAIHEIVDGENQKRLLISKFK